MPPPCTSLIYDSNIIKTNQQAQLKFLILQGILFAAKQMPVLYAAFQFQKNQHY